MSGPVDQRRDLGDGRPHSRLTVRVRRDVFVDAAAYRLVRTFAGRRDPALVERVAEEVDAALAVFEEQGWLDAPETYHEAPPPLTGLRSARARSGRLRYTSISWLDGYTPRPEEPGSAAYAAHRPNRVGRAALLEHRSDDRPWLICVHGFGMGRTGMDLRAFRALHLHRTLGLNLAFPVLPFHGRRNPGARFASMPSADVLETIHGLAQCVWDVRQLLAHLRSRSDQPVGLLGLSLGGLVSAMVASLDRPDAALLLVPAVDMPTLMAEGAALSDDVTDDERDLMKRSEPLFAPVSPLRLTPTVPREARFIVAGTLDRFARPRTQAMALWEHWERPELRWYHGGHVSLFWARNVQAAIDDKLRAVRLA